MTDKELNDYIINSFIMSFDRGLSFDFEKITLKALASYGTSDNELSRGLKSKLKTKGIEEIYKIQLLNSGYIKVTNDTIPLKYELTNRGMKVQEIGGLIEFLKNEKWKRKLKILKAVSLYILPWFLALVSTIGLIYTIVKPDKPITIQQPIRLQLDSLPENCFHGQENQNKNLNKAKTENIKK